MGKGRITISVRVNLNLDNRSMKSSTDVVEVRQNEIKKRRLRVLENSFEPNFNGASASAVVFQWPVTILNKRIMKHLIRSFINELSK